MVDGRAAVMSYLQVQLSPRRGALHHSVHHTDQSLALAHLWQIRKNSHDANGDRVISIQA